MRNVLLALCGLALLGCGSSTPSPPTAGAPASGIQAGTPVHAGRAGGGGGSITPIGSGMATGSTPIAGSDSVEGVGGGSVGAAAKAQAKKAAASESKAATTEDTGD